MKMGLSRKISRVKIRIDPLDKLFSEFIRKKANGKCGKCGKFGRLEVSHFWGRARKSVRWDEDNVVALCFLCHRYFTANPYEHVIWFQGHLGMERFVSLRDRMMDMTRVDKEELLEHYKQKIKELGDRE